MTMGDFGWIWLRLVAFFGRTSGTCLQGFQNMDSYRRSKARIAARLIYVHRKLIEGDALILGKLAKGLPELRLQ
jgi:hypothetical protein